MKKGVLRWGGESTCNVMFLEEAFDVTLHVGGDTTGGGINFDVLAKVRGFASISATMLVVGRWTILTNLSWTRRRI